MNHEKPGKVVSLEGGRKPRPRRRDREPIDGEEEHATLILEGEEINLKKFVLSGESIEGKRVVLTWAVTTDEFLVAVATLQAVANKKLSQIIDGES
jgi:hypothetical protein